MPMTTRCKSSGLISAPATTTDAQSTQRENFLFIFLCGEGGSDYSSDEKVSFLWEVATKQAPGNPQADWCFFFDQSQETGGRHSSNNHTGACSLSGPLRDRDPCPAQQPLGQLSQGMLVLPFSYFRGMKSCHAGTL